MANEQSPRTLQQFGVLRVRCASGSGLWGLFPCLQTSGDGPADWTVTPRRENGISPNISHSVGVFLEKKCKTSVETGTRIYVRTKSRWRFTYGPGSNRTSDACSKACIVMQLHYSAGGTIPRTSTRLCDLNFAFDPARKKLCLTVSGEKRIWRPGVDHAQCIGQLASEAQTRMRPDVCNSHGAKSAPKDEDGVRWPRLESNERVLHALRLAQKEAQDYWRHALFFNQIQWAHAQVARSIEKKKKKGIRDLLEAQARIERAMAAVHINPPVEYSAGVNARGDEAEVGGGEGGVDLVHDGVGAHIHAVVGDGVIEHGLVEDLLEREDGKGRAGHYNFVGGIRGRVVGLMVFDRGRKSTSRRTRGCGPSATGRYEIAFKPAEIQPWDKASTRCCLGADYPRSGLNWFWRFWDKDTGRLRRALMTTGYRHSGYDSEATGGAHETGYAPRSIDRARDPKISLQLNSNAPNRLSRDRGISDFTPAAACPSSGPGEKILEFQPGKCRQNDSKPRLLAHREQLAAGGEKILEINIKRTLQTRPNHELTCTKASLAGRRYVVSGLTAVRAIHRLWELSTAARRGGNGQMLKCHLPAGGAKFSGKWSEIPSESRHNARLTGVEPSLAAKKKPQQFAPSKASACSGTLRINGAECTGRLRTYQVCGTVRGKARAQQFECGRVIQRGKRGESWVVVVVVVVVRKEGRKSGGWFPDKLRSEVLLSEEKRGQHAIGEFNCWALSMDAVMRVLIRHARTKKLTRETHPKGPKLKRKFNHPNSRKGRRDNVAFDHHIDFSAANTVGLGHFGPCLSDVSTQPGADSATYGLRDGHNGSVHFHAFPEVLGWKPRFRSPSRQSFVMRWNGYAAHFGRFLGQPEGRGVRMTFWFDDRKLLFFPRWTSAAHFAVKACATAHKIRLRHFPCNWDFRGMERPWTEILESRV
ncbi:hypothetical protein C8R47DRAFT_1239916 [Mycena vitilis]|nr:hypothetical protein C8R47DRAFT_1239916 [Mycena vitilis]